MPGTAVPSNLRFALALVLAALVLSFQGSLPSPIAVVLMALALLAMALVLLRHTGWLLG